MPEQVAVVPPGSALVRIRVVDALALDLPAAPSGTRLTVTLGHADLAEHTGHLAELGYVVVGVAADHRPLGHVADVLVPAAIREAAPVWWADLRGRADRVFDLAFGPVARVLAPEIDLHLRAAV